ncbi:MAG: hypothetical protein L3J59_10035 [Methylococcaceae bacterium]|nr:hypothetical protein [Methylococcaceae bacterium]
MSEKIFRMFFLSVLILYASTGCARKVPWYEGYYFDAKINGLKVVKIENKSSITSLKGFSRYGNVQWMVKGMVQGDLDVVVENNTISNDFIGQIDDEQESDIYVYALDDQDLDSTNELTVSKDVFINGAGAVKNEEFLTSGFMPSGAYVISIKTFGTDNWDRKYVYVEFK